MKIVISNVSFSKRVHHLVPATPRVQAQGISSHGAGSRGAHGFSGRQAGFGRPFTHHRRVLIRTS